MSRIPIDKLTNPDDTNNVTGHHTDKGYRAQIDDNSQPRSIHFSLPTYTTRADMMTKTFEQESLEFI